MLDGLLKVAIYKLVLASFYIYLQSHLHDFSYQILKTYAIEIQNKHFTGMLCIKFFVNNFLKWAIPDVIDITKIWSSLTMNAGKYNFLCW